MKRRENLRLFCFAHNFSGFDSHLIVTALGKMQVLAEVDAVAQNTQKFKSLDIGSVRLLDSSAFLPSSLEKLVEDLVASNHSFPLLSKTHPDDAQRKLLLRKGVFPYDFVDSIERLTSTLELPPRSSFFNKLSGEEVSEEDYAHAEKVWEAFECKTMADFSDVYVRSDTILLAEVFMNLRHK